LSEAKLTERQIKLISIVSALPEKPRLTLLQKIVFLCMERVKSCDVNYPYIIGHYGPFSVDLINDLEDLEKKGIVKFGKEKQVIVTYRLKDKWPNAEETISEFKTCFPDDSSIIASALTSPNVLGRPVGEFIKTSR
jgi:uncharacterized protein YwgA